jgi:hypothetical protein
LDHAKLRAYRQFVPDRQVGSGYLSAINERQHTGISVLCPIIYSRTIWGINITVQAIDLPCHATF